MKRLLLALGLTVGIAAWAEPKPLLVLHLDFNSVQMRKECVIDCLRTAAAAGYNAVLWEVEDKIRWETCPECVRPDAFAKEEFRSILDEADRLGLRPIPLMQTFGHAEYVLAHEKYAHLREDPDFPGCYCTSNPEALAFQRRLLHEYLELFGDRVKDFHLGGDEAIVFGTCPACRTQNRLELYARHLKAVAAELRERGVRPGIWCDMLYKAKSDDEALQIPRDFTVWNWDYGLGTAENDAIWAGKIGLLKNWGYDVVFAASTASWGDSPFLPRYRKHGDNVAASAALARREGFRGFCVTSWSVHPFPKRLQYPLWEFAAKRYRTPDQDVERDLADCLVRHFGPVGAEAIRKLTEWDGRFMCLDGRFWRPYVKWARPAPAGHLAKVLASQGKADPGFRASWKASAVGLETDIRSALAQVRRQAKGNADASLLAEGAELSLTFLETVSPALDGRPSASAPLAKTTAFYAREQSPHSASNAAAFVWSVVTAEATDAARRAETARIQGEIDRVAAQGGDRTTIRGLVFENVRIKEPAQREVN